ncbi:saccharopine dehydrogenase NADP-binding domain-containing protein [Actinoplanes couchii]|uniref:Saccharopine dehydrogenase n=1 Tax=Actinoplanes couchii TaxID=403638 RepID=A0ABQ3XDR3_9ACTN|nr:saccharopine dehydrogenase [Actinoplanes couchii]
MVGAYGHTGGFVVKELIGRGFRVRSIGRADPLDLRGAAAVINCAGPFATTAGPVIEAAIGAGVPYVDVAAEIEANADTFTRFAGAPIPIVPAMAFFGGLADLLVSAITDTTAVDTIDVAYGLSGWQPTRGTLTAGAVSRERRDGRRVRFTGGRLDYYRDDSPLPVVRWEFPGATRPVLSGFTMAEVVTIPSHLTVGEIRSHMSVAAAGELAAAGEREAPETFTVDVHVRTGDDTRRITVTGRDIYATSAPLAVEAVTRLLDGRFRGPGVASAGAMFDARDFPLPSGIERYPATVGSAGNHRLA